MINTLVFDLDGTLVNTLPDLTRGVNYSLVLNGFNPHSEEEVMSYLGNGSRVLISKAIGIKVNPETFQKVFDDYLNYYLEHVDVKSFEYEGMLEVLKAFKSKGFKLFVLTNKPNIASRRLCKSLFGDIFDCVLGNSKEIPTKPDLTGFNFLKKEYNLNDDEICYFGDSDVDMIIARKANCAVTVACAYGFRDVEELKKYNPEFIINSPREILKLNIFSKIF
jgi:phosphoglycolate phosphatase